MDDAREPREVTGMDEERDLALEGLQRLMEANPGKFEAMLERGARDLEFAFAHMEEWRRIYPNHWIAVFDQKLVAAESSPDLLLQRLREQNIPRGESFVKFLPKTKILSIPG